jgi:hypothetical protein
VPASWFEVDLRPATRDNSASELVRQRIKDAPELRERRADIAKLLRRQAAAAWDAGAVYCAVMAEPVADGLLPGSVTVSFISGPLDADSSAEDRFGPLLTPFTPKKPKNPDDTWTEITMVELPKAGTAARVYGVEDVEIESGRPLRMVTMQTFVPLPDVNRVAIVGCSSPAVVMAAALHDVFDAITSTFSLYRTRDLLEASS